MYTYITLNQFIAELQTIAEQNDKRLGIPYGEFTLFSIGSCCGEIGGKKNPFSFRLKECETDADRTVYVNSMMENF